MALPRAVLLCQLAQTALAYGFFPGMGSSLDDIPADALKPGASAGVAMGAMKLDNYTLDKVLAFPGHSVLVKVDKQYASGDAENEFKILAKLSHKVSKFLIGNVPVTGFGDKENDDIRARFKLQTEDFPAYFLFSETHKEGLRYSGQVKADQIAAWLRKSGVNFPAIGTIAELDEIAQKFMAGKGEEHIAAAKALAAGEYKEDRRAPMYVKIMERLKEKGDDFIRMERERVSKVLKGKVSEEKQAEMQDKLKVLGAFVV